MAICALFVAQGAAIAVQHQQINDLKAMARTPGPRGETGPQGLPGLQGLRGPAGPAGRNGRDGEDARPVTEWTVEPQVTQMTAVEARAYCTDLAERAWPTSSTGDSTMDALTNSYSSVQQEKAFKDCMSDKGHPQP
ncbi:collagen-like protein [Streptomyces sp. NPDC052095]|uniref:collagen-like triple helix repeat-containing protein n=1 Tax=unclassified Streptomyces TaxID=2593676 RepID=UPI00344F8F07